MILAEEMKQIAIIVSLLIVPSLVALATGGDVDWAGRLGLALVFAFAALGHFIKTDAMAEMLPPSVPQRRALIRISGVFELALAVLVLRLPNSRLVALTIIWFLIAVFPSNVYAAVRRIESGTLGLPALSLCPRPPSTSPDSLDVLVCIKRRELGSRA